MQLPLRIAPFVIFRLRTSRVCPHAPRCGPPLPSLPLSLSLSLCPSHISIAIIMMMIVAHNLALMPTWSRSSTIFQPSHPVSV